MENVPREVLICIFEFLPISELLNVKPVCHSFNNACSTYYFLKSKSFDSFRSMYPDSEFPLRDIGDLDPLDMVTLPLLNPFIQYGEMVADKTCLEEFEFDMVEERFKKLSKLAENLKKYDIVGGVCQFWVFDCHPYFKMLMKGGKNFKFPAIMHQLGVLEAILWDNKEIDESFLKYEKKILNLIKNKKSFEDIKICEMKPNNLPISAHVNQWLGGMGGRRSITPLCWCDLIGHCSNPPYGIKRLPNTILECEDNIRKILWNDFKKPKDIEVLKWADMNSDWAKEFESGKEWWGVYLVSYYIRSLNVLVIGYANSTD